MTRPQETDVAVMVVKEWEHLTHRLYLRLKAGDELGARRVVDRLTRDGCDVVGLCEGLFTPLLHQLGEEWAHGALSVAEEHRASAIIERLLDRIEPPRTRAPRGVAMVATVQGEQHGLPALMATLALKADGWHTHHVGTQVPARDLAALAAAEHAHFVVLSATRVETVASAEVAATVIRWATGRPVYVGGPGATLRDLLDLVNG